METGTVLFVSHDMSAVQNLCESAIWLNQGEVLKIGSAKSVAKSYLQYSLQEVYGDDRHLTSVAKDPEGDELIEEGTAQKMTTITYEAKMSDQDNLTKAKGWKTGAAELLGIRLAQSYPGFYC